MPNILVDKKVIPEFIQKEAVPEKVAAEAIRLLQDEAARNSLLNGYQEIRETLGLPGTLRYLAKVFVGIVERSF